MRKDYQWFELYEESHQNRTNKIIHYFCVPIILYTIIGILDALSKAPYWNLSFSLAHVLIIGGGLFYFSLNWKLTILALSGCIAMLLSLPLYPTTEAQLYINIALFVVAWIFQFVGHKIEGKKPSFLQDIVFLFIGPIWIIDAWFNFKLRSQP